MSFWRTKRRTVVGVTTVPLVDTIPNILQRSVLIANLRQTNTSDEIMSNIKNGFFGQLRRLYQYGNSDYHYGLPESFLSGFSADVPVLKNIILTELGRDISFLELSTDTLDPAYYLYGYMVATWQLDLLTKIVNNPPEEIGAPSGAIIKLVNVIGFSGNFGFLLVNMADEDGNQYQQPVFRNEPINTTDDFVQMIYSYPETVDGVTTTKYDYWFYNTSDETYPDLGNTTIDLGIPYYPIIPIRQNKENTIDDPDEDKVKSVKRALRIIGTDLKKLTDAVMSEEEGNEPDKIDGIFVHIALNIFTETKESNLYLHKYFKLLGLASIYDKTSFDLWATNSNALDPQYNESKIQEDSFDTLLRYNYISTEIKTGVVGKINEVVKSIVFGDPVLKVDFNYVTVAQVTDSVVLQKQLTADTYEEVVVNGLVHITTGRDGVQYVVPLKEAYESKQLGEDGTSNGLFIPLSKPIMDTMTLLQQSTVAYDALNLVVYTSDVIKIKWYQKPIVGQLLKLTAIVITVVSLGTANNLSAALVALAVNLAVMIVLTVILKFAVKILGEEFALWAALIMIAVSVYYGGYGTENTLPWAQDLMMVATATINATNQVTIDNLKKIQIEMDDFLKTAKELEEEIKELESMLHPKGTEGLLELVRNIYVFDSRETPDMFFNRTIHETNPGVRSLDMIGNYVERLLQLPKVNAYE
jgi:hypothetical protein